MAGVRAEVTPEGRRKLIVMRSIPTASGRILARWGANAVKNVIRYADSVMSKGPGKRTAQLRRNIGLEVRTFVDATRVTVGTGVGGAKNIAYATIQDRGGTTHPTVTEKMRKWAWAMHYKEFGREVRGLGLKGRARRGAFETWRNLSKYAAIALTKKSKLDVKIPSSLWFTAPMEKEVAVLQGYLKPENVLAEAAKSETGGE